MRSTSAASGEKATLVAHAVTVSTGAVAPTLANNDTCCDSVYVSSPAAQRALVKRDCEGRKKTSDLHLSVQHIR